MNRLIGIGVMVLVLYGLLVGSYETARSVNNHLDLARRLGFYGILTLGVGVLIISGGIDLSIGSLVGLSAVTFGTLVQAQRPGRVGGVSRFAGAAVIGLFHGLLVTKLRLQPFLVTLCGLFIYRGLARTISQKTVGLTVADAGQGGTNVLQAKQMAGRQVGGGRDLRIAQHSFAFVSYRRSGDGGRALHRLWPLPLCDRGQRTSGPLRRHRDRSAKDRGVHLHGRDFGAGRHPLPDGVQQCQSDHRRQLVRVVRHHRGRPRRLRLRGGEGSVPGMVLGAAVLPLLAKLCNFTSWIGSEQEYTVIGAALLTGTVANELIRRFTRAGR